MKKFLSLTKQLQPRTHDQPWSYLGYLQHYDDLEKPQSTTFRLYDAVPKHVVDAWKQELQITGSISSSDPNCIELRRRIATYEDAGYGHCWLKQKPVAGIVENSLLHFDDERYQLLAWCIMPNHVHVMFGRKNGFSMESIQHSWKSYTAKEINKILGKTGQVWDTESYDRFIRDERHLQNVRAYIENNPVVAGLAKAPWEWQHSSAHYNWQRKSEP